MTEEEFIRNIDCNFPYYNTDAAIELMDLAISISANAIFMIVHELARLPSCQDIDQDRRRHLLSELAKRFDHPLKKHVLKAAESCIAGRSLPDGEALSILNVIRQYPHQYNALAVVAASFEDATGIADDQYDKIIEAWQAGQRKC